MNSKDISEKAFESQVKSLAKIFGWRYYHTWRSIHSPAGFPDCVLVRPPRLIFAELKSEKGKLTPEQQEWLEALKECQKVILLEEMTVIGRKAILEIGNIIPSLTIPEVYLWKPSMFDEVRRILE